VENLQQKSVKKLNRTIQQECVKAMEITASQVKELREKTGVGLMDCKKALAQSNGVVDDAVKYLRERGLAAAAKKADRSATEGRVFTGIVGNKGVIVEVNCETDFVASNDAFKGCGEAIIKTTLGSDDISDIDKLKSSEIDGKTYKAFVSEIVLKVGENVDAGKLTVINTDGQLFDYVHMNGKIGVLVEFNKAVSAELGKDVAMHIAATNPSHVSSDAVSADEVAKETEIIRNQALNEGKPEQIVEKIVEGRIAKYYKEVCLLEQVFVKDQDKTIKQLMPEGVTVSSFTRYSLV
jgi:elongation factor Ts